MTDVAALRRRCLKTLAPWPELRSDVMDALAELERAQRDAEYWQDSSRHRADLYRQLEAEAKAVVAELGRAATEFRDEVFRVGANAVMFLASQRLDQALRRAGRFFER